LVIISDDKIINADGNWQASAWPVGNVSVGNWQLISELSCLNGLNFFDNFVKSLGLLGAIFSLSAVISVISDDGPFSNTSIVEVVSVISDDGPFSNTSIVEVVSVISDDGPFSNTSIVASSFVVVILFTKMWVALKPESRRHLEIIS
jgi:hypothetical protein